MTRRDYLRRLASQRREYAADALRCAADADKAERAGAEAEAALARDREDSWFRLLAEAATEYDLVKNRRRRPGVLPFRRA